MQRIKLLFLESVKEMKKTSAIVEVAMLLAVSVTLGFFAVQLTESLKISFAFLAEEMIAMLFGPVVGMITGGLADILKYIVHPTGAFFPGFTISGMVNGLLYGMILYKRPLSIKRIIVANVVAMFFVNLLLNTLWITLLYGSAFMVILPTRVMAQVIQLPIRVVVFYSISRIFVQIREHYKIESRVE